MSCSVTKLSSTCVSVLSILTLTACGGGGGGSNSPSSGALTSAPDRTAPVISFNPSAITTESELSVDVTLTASDNVGIITGPTVVCVSNTGTGGTGTFLDSVFTAPFVIFTVSNTCTATVSDAAGNQAEAILEITIEPAPDFSRITDTITTDPVLGMINIPTDPNPGFDNTSPDTLVGLTRNASNGNVSIFAANAIDSGEFDEAVVTVQSTLGTVGTAPLDTLFADISGVAGDTPDFIFLDDVNDEIVAVALNGDNTVGFPVIQSIPNACAAGRGADTEGSFFDPELGRVSTTQTDILVGTTNGLFNVIAGDKDENGGSGLSVPMPIVSSGNFCDLFVDEFVRETIYASYNSDTGVISAFQETSGDSNNYESIFTSNISDRIPAGAEHLLIDGFQDGFGLDAIYNVFTNPEGGTILLISATGGSQPVTVYDLDIDTPTDIVVFELGLQQRVVLTSPTSERAAYIPRAGRDEIEYFEIGLAIDQVDFSEDVRSLTFSSSTQPNVIIRRQF